MFKKRFVLHLSFLTILFLFASSFVVVAASVPRISTDELKSHLGEDALLVLDVRSNRDWVGSAVKVVDAVRVDPGRVDQWASNYSKESKIVLYCA